MNKYIRSRIYYVLMISLLVGVGVAMIIYALKENINLYLTPTEIYTRQNLSANKMIRLGGLIKPKSIEHGYNGHVKFTVTDGKNDVQVKYQGILPGLFKSGKGVVVEGYYQFGHLSATRVLAKHDENYKPPKVNQ